MLKIRPCWRLEKLIPPRSFNQNRHIYITLLTLIHRPASWQPIYRHVHRITLLYHRRSTDVIRKQHNSVRVTNRPTSTLRVYAYITLTTTDTETRILI